MARCQSPRRSSTAARASSRRTSALAGSVSLPSASSSRRAARAASPRFSSSWLRAIARSTLRPSGTSRAAASSARSASSYFPSSRSCSAARRRESKNDGVASGNGHVRGDGGGAIVGGGRRRAHQQRHLAGGQARLAGALGERARLVGPLHRPLEPAGRRQRVRVARVRHQPIDQLARLGDVAAQHQPARVRVARPPSAIRRDRSPPGTPPWRAGPCWSRCAARPAAAAPRRRWARARSRPPAPWPPRPARPSATPASPAARARAASPAPRSPACAWCRAPPADPARSPAPRPAPGACAPRPRGRRRRTPAPSPRAAPRSPARGGPSSLYVSARCARASCPSTVGAICSERVICSAASSRRPSRMNSSARWARTSAASGSNGSARCSSSAASFQRSSCSSSIARVTCSYASGLTARVTTTRPFTIFVTGCGVVAQPHANTTAARRRAPPRRLHSGMFPCFLGGLESRLLPIAASARTSLARVSRGRITSST